jgi:glycosyltransferase 2 family protein
MSGNGSSPHRDEEAVATDPRRRNLIVLGVASVALTLSTVAARAPLTDAEVRVFRAANDLPQGLYAAVWPVMQYGTFITIPTLAVVAMVFRRFRLAVAMLLSGVGVYLLAIVIKGIVKRERPAGLLDAVESRETFAEGSLGYPSGHAAVAAALTLVVSTHLSRRWTFVALALGIAVLFGRMYVGAHLPLDVVGGAALGTVAGSVVNLLIPALPETQPAAVPKRSLNT